MKNHLLYLLFSLALLSSCNTSKEIIYFQDVEVNSPKAVAPPQDITVQPKDQISIIVSSKDPELAALFNLTRVQQRVGSTGLNNNNNNGEISGYTLDDKGAIDFPVLGSLTVAGMTRSQIAALVKQRLKEENLVNDPVVTVEFMNLSFSVLGEVKTPGNPPAFAGSAALCRARVHQGSAAAAGRSAPWPAPAGTDRRRSARRLCAAVGHRARENAHKSRRRWR